MLTRVLMLLLSLALGACAAGNREALGDALAEYAYGVRWGRPDWIKPHLPRSGPAPYDPARNPSGLQVVTCEVESVNLAAGGERAEVGLRVEWYLVEQNRLFSSLLRQTWRWTSDRWELREQRTAQGAPFPPPAS
jgi:hypothetical protein